MWQLMRLGVDIIITNRPDVLKQVLLTGPEMAQSSAGHLPSMPHP
jgi:hypothetical protein